MVGLVFYMVMAWAVQCQAFKLQRFPVDGFLNHRASLLSLIAFSMMVFLRSHLLQLMWRFGHHGLLYDFALLPLPCSFSKLEFCTGGVGR